MAIQKGSPMTAATTRTMPVDCQIQGATFYLDVPPERLHCDSQRKPWIMLCLGLGLASYGVVATALWLLEDILIGGDSSYAATNNNESSTYSSLVDILYRTVFESMPQWVGRLLWMKIAAFLGYIVYLQLSE